MNIYIPTSNKYIYMVEALLYSLKKYWYNFEDTKVTIVGYDSPQYDLPENVLFESIGTNDDVKNWAIDLKNYFKSVDDEYFVYMNDDAAIVDNLDIELFNLFLDVIDKNTEHSNVKLGRISLTKDVSNLPNEVIGDYGDFSLVQLNQSSDYRLSTQFSIWNKEYLIMYMNENMSPWEFELQSSAKNDNWTILGTRNRYCLDFYHLWRRGGKSGTWNVGTHSGKKLSEVSDDYNFISNVLSNNNE